MSRSTSWPWASAAFLADLWFSGLQGGGPTQSPPVEGPAALDLPGVADWAKTVEDRHWFLVSDLASVLGALTRNLSSLTLLVVLLFIATYFVLWRTGFGLRLRSCGESPGAAETLGVNVYRYKIIAVLISGSLAGLAGGFIVLVGAGLYQNGITNGRGFIGLAAMIFGNWRPGGLLLGSVLFGYTDALQLRAGGGAVHALLIVVAIVLLVYGIYQLRRGARVAGIVTVVAARAGRHLVLHDRRGARRLHPHDAVRRDPLRARVLGPAAADARRRRTQIPARRGGLTWGWSPRSTRGRIWSSRPPR